MAYTKAKQVHAHNRTAFTLDFFKYNTIMARTEKGLFFRIKKSELWSEAKTNRIDYYLTDKIFKNGRTVMVVL